MKQLLTGKCLEDFETYCKDKYDSDDYIIVNGFGDRTTFYSIITWYEKCPVEMQFGAIQGFGDSVGINITLYQLDYQEWYGYNIVKFGKPVITGGVWRRDKAREEAIKHFNKLYNAKY